MQALVLHGLKQPLEQVQRSDLEPAAGEVVIQLKAAALNRRDYWITQGMYPGIRMPVILGSDGAGVVSKLGQGVDRQWDGRETIINPGWEWGDLSAAQADSFRILGMPDDGTLATEVAVPASYLHDKPTHLDWRQAAALPLAGVTAYRAVFSQGRLQPGERVLISGVGGGVATFALQFSVAAGANVFVTSSSDAKIEQAIQLGGTELDRLLDAKIEQAIQLGATAGFKYTEEDWQKRFKAEHGAADLIIDSAGGAGYQNLIDLGASGGRIVNYGATAGPPKNFDLMKVFWKQLHLIGSTMGSPADFAAMLDHVNEHQLTPVVDDALPLVDANEALQRMRNSQQFGKIVLDCQA